MFDISEFSPYADAYLSENKQADIANDVTEYVRFFVGERRSSLTTLQLFLASRGINSVDVSHFVHSSVKGSVFDIKERDRLLFEELSGRLNLHWVGIDYNVFLFYLNGTDNNRATCVGAIYINRRNIRDTFNIYGNEVFRHRIEMVLGEVLHDDNSVVIHRIVEHENGGLREVSERVVLNEYHNVATTFYPELPEPSTLWEGFANSNSNVVLMQGDVGTGKSTYLREVLSCRGWNEDIYIVDSTNVIENAGLGDYLRKLPKGAVVVFEDADALIGRRTDGNNAMSTLLNATSGIASINVKLIFTTNLPNLKSVDPALLRPGRTYKLLEFKPMTLEQAQTVRRFLDRDPDVLTIDRPYTLAEAINYDEITHDLDNRGFGFS